MEGVGTWTKSKMSNRVILTLSELGSGLGCGEDPCRVTELSLVR